MTCARPECRHPRAIHAGDACRIGGCPCAGFDDGKKQPTGPRRVAIDVPDGYAVSITLMPAYAAGGLVEGGGTYIVGESGPELFVPEVAGSIQRRKGKS